MTTGSSFILVTILVAIGLMQRNIALVTKATAIAENTQAAFSQAAANSESTLAAMKQATALSENTRAIRTAVAEDPDSIGFLSFGYLDDSTKALDIDGVAATAENAISGAYPIVRPLLFVTLGEPEGKVKEFIDFCLSTEGQAIVAEDYIPVI